MRAASFLIPALLAIGASADRLLPRNAAIPLAALERRATAIETRVSIQTVANDIADIPAATASAEASAASAVPAAGDVNNVESRATCEAKGWVTCGSTGTSCMPPGAVCCLDTQKSGELGSFCTTGSYCVTEGTAQSCKENFKPSASASASNASSSAKGDANSGAERVSVYAGMGIAVLGGLVMVVL